MLSNSSSNINVKISSIEKAYDTAILEMSKLMNILKMSKLSVPMYSSLLVMLIPRVLDLTKL